MKTQKQPPVKVRRQARIVFNGDTPTSWHDCGSVTHVQAAYEVALKANLHESTNLKEFVQTRDLDSPDVIFDHGVVANEPLTIIPFRGD